MTRTRGGVLAVVALLVLAGCLGSLVGPASGATTADAMDGSGVAVGQANGTAETGNDSATEFPPGVSQSGVEDPDALVSAHRQALAESGYSFVLQTNLSTAFAGGVEQWAVQNGSVEAGLSPFRFRTVTRLLFENESASPPAAVTEAWGNDTTVVVRTQRGNVTQVQRISRSAGGDLRLDPDGPGAGPGPGDGRTQAIEGLLTQTTVIRTVLRSGEYEVTEVREEGGRTLVTLAATELNASAFDGDAENVSSFDASLVVDEAGRVLRIDYDLAFERGSGPSVRYRYRVTDLGSGSVERPAWVAEAFEPVPSGNSTAVAG